METVSVKAERAPLLGPYVINFYGMTASGADLSPVRTALSHEFGAGNVFSPSSGLFGRHGYRRGESLKARYNRFADTVLNNSEGRSLAIHGSSAGAFEALDTMQALLDKGLKDRQVTFLISCTPGAVTKGPRGLLRMARDFVDQASTMHDVDHHVTYPGPDSLYPQVAQVRSIAPGGVINHTPLDVEEDTSEKRAEKRAKFKELLPSLIPDARKRHKFLAELTGIDAKIEMDLRDGNTESLGRFLKMRAKLLKPYKNRYFHGGQNDPEINRALMEQYDETEEATATMLGMIGQSLALAGRMIRDVNTGYVRRLSQIARQAKAQGVEVNFALAVMEKDPLVTVDDLPTVVANFKEVGLHLASVTFLQTLGHQSIGQDPSGVIIALNNALSRARA